VLTASRSGSTSGFELHPLSAIARGPFRVRQT
jgi:hypothetical protein